MPQLDLDANEASILKDTLESVASDLGYEIANTDSKDFRDKLKEKQSLLKQLAAKLGGG